jgi:hypothetical protein
MTDSPSSPPPADLAANATAKKAAAYLGAAIDNVGFREGGTPDDYPWPRKQDDPARMLLALYGVGQAILALNETLSASVPEPPRRRWLCRRGR